MGTVDNKDCWVKKNSEKMLGDREEKETRRCSQEKVSKEACSWSSFSVLSVDGCFVFSLSL